MSAFSAKNLLRRAPLNGPRFWLLLSVLPYCACALAANVDDDARARPTLQLYTEHFPPYSMTIDGSESARSADQITGFATETVKELLQRAAVHATIELVPWKRAYAEALQQANSGVFSTSRTTEREALFQWVGPLVETNWVFMARADHAIEITTLADAGRYRIGGYLDDSIAIYLEEQGLEVDYVRNDVLNVRKLKRGRIDLWPVVEGEGPPALAVQEQVAVKKVFTIKRTTMALALNLDTDPELVARLQTTLDLMRDDGTVDRLKTRYAPSRNPDSKNSER